MFHNYFIAYIFRVTSSYGMISYIVLNSSQNDDSDDDDDSDNDNNGNDAFVSKSIARTIYILLPRDIYFSCEMLTRVRWRLASSRVMIYLWWTRICALGCVSHGIRNCVCDFIFYILLTIFFSPFFSLFLLHLLPLFLDAMYLRVFLETGENASSNETARRRRSNNKGFFLCNEWISVMPAYIFHWNSRNKSLHRIDPMKHCHSNFSHLLFFFLIAYATICWDSFTCYRCILQELQKRRRKTTLTWFMFLFDDKRMNNAKIKSIRLKFHFFFAIYCW